MTKCLDWTDEHCGCRSCAQIPVTGAKYSGCTATEEDARRFIRDQPLALSSFISSPLPRRPPHPTGELRVVAEIVDDFLPGFYWKDNRVLHTERQTCFVGKTLHDFTHQIRHVANATNNGSFVAPECFNAKASEVRVYDELVSPR